MFAEPILPRDVWSTGGLFYVQYIRLLLFLLDRLAPVNTRLSLLYAHEVTEVFSAREHVDLDVTELVNVTATYSYAIDHVSW